MFNAEQCLEEVKCPIQYTLDLIGSKWSIPILRELFLVDAQDGIAERRTHELLESLSGISSKTLMIRLRELEKHGIVVRKVYAEIPPHVGYSLTDKGRQLQPVMTALHQVGIEWLKQDACICPLDQKMR